METTSPKSVLILTAGFGDGHDSAARNLAGAVRQLTGGGTAVQVVDLFDEASAMTSGFLKWGYRFLITHAPRGWKWLYDNTQSGDLTNLWWDHFMGLTRALERRLRELRPDVVICTYPVYPLVFPRIEETRLLPRRLLTVVTDSISIHPSWHAGRADCVYVTDEISADLVRKHVGGSMPVEVAGFAVDAAFADFRERALPPAGAALRVLYFATTATSHVAATLRSLLAALPAGSAVTVAAGRHLARLDKCLTKIAAAFPHVPLRIVGWTREVPQLLLTHDVVISKAGGATTHECLAAGVPVLVNHVIPGQEEGNVILLEALGCGRRMADGEDCGAVLAAMCKDGSLRTLQEAAVRERRADGALKIARAALADL